VELGTTLPRNSLHCLEFTDMGFTDILKKAYPFISIAASLGGPLGEMGASALGKAIGASVKPGDLSSTLSSLATSETGRIQLDAAEKQFAETMAKMGYDNAQALEKIAADDRASARTMQISTKSWIPSALALFITAGFFGILAGMFKYEPPQTAHDALMLMLGALGGAWTSVVAYYFGSSAGSAGKDSTIAAALGKN